MATSPPCSTALSDSQVRQRKALADALAGVVGTLVSLWTFYPMDAWKTQVQAGLAVDRHRNQTSDLFRGWPVKTLHAAASSFCYFYLDSFLVRWWTLHRPPPHPRQHNHLSPAVRLSLSALAAMVNTLLTLPLDVWASRQQANTTNSKSWEEVPRETSAHETPPESDASSTSGHQEPNLTIPRRQPQQPQQQRTMEQVWKELQHPSTLETPPTLDDAEGDVFYDSCSEAQQPSNSNQSSFDNEEEKEDGSASCRLMVTVTASPLPRFRSNTNKLFSMEPTPGIRYNKTGNKPTSIATKKVVVPSLSELLALWKGLAPSLLLCSNPSIHYTVFDIAKSHLLQSRTRASSSSLSLSMMEAFWLGLLAKFCATMATYPLIRAKVMLMVTSSKKTSLLKTLLESYQRDGLARGWYKGCSLQLAHTVLKSALLMMVKESIAQTTHRMLVPTHNPPTHQP